MTCQRSLTHSEEERKDGVPKKYDPKKERKDGNGERISQEKGAFIHLVHWSDQLVNMRIFSLWIQSLIFQQK